VTTVTTAAATTFLSGFALLVSTLELWQGAYSLRAQWWRLHRANDWVRRRWIFAQTNFLAHSGCGDSGGL